MSELKAYTYDDMIDGDADTNIEYYPKSEADKVIANRDYEIKNLKDSIGKLLKAKTEQIITEVMQKTLIYGEGFIRVEDAMKLIAELRHNKYKRCLAMAKWCALAKQFKDTEWYEKWINKWLNKWWELAEKFKPNYSTAHQGLRKQTMINEQVNTDASMSKCIRNIPRSNSDVVCELAYERREVSSLLEKLNRAIEADPKVVSAHHKELWRKQAKAMQEYVDVLGERIKDLIDNG